MSKIVHNGKEMLAVWNGYRLLFSGRKLKLKTDHLIPFHKPPKLSTAQIGFLKHNLIRVFRGMNNNYYWLFVFANAVYRYGELSSPFALDLSDRDISEMHEIYRQYLEMDFEEEFRELTKNSALDLQSVTGKSKVVQAVIDGDLSIVAAMMYHSRVEPLDLTGFDRKSLLGSRVLRIIEMCLYLEDDYAFSDKILHIQKKLKVD